MAARPKPRRSPAAPASQFNLGSTFSGRVPTSAARATGQTPARDSPLARVQFGYPKYVATLDRNPCPPRDVQKARYLRARPLAWKMSQG